MPTTYAFIGDSPACHEMAHSLQSGGFKQVQDIALADVVFTYCTSQQALEDAYFDSEGVIALAHEGAFLVDLSPSTPALSKEIAAMATVNAQYAVEAPVVVADVAAQQAFASAANLGMFVAGDEWESVREMLEAIACNQIACKQAGQAQLARCITTLLCCSQLVGAMEALSLARQVDPSGDTLAAAAAFLPKVANSAMSAAMAESWVSSYSVEVLAGEVEAAMAAADEVGLVLPQAEAAEYLVRMLAIIDGSHMSAAALSLLYVDETLAAKHGLDWSRADQMYAEMEDASMGPGEDDEYLDYEDDGYDYGYDGGFGYSPN